jgi:hypothetical protein
MTELHKPVPSLRSVPRPFPKHTGSQLGAAIFFGLLLIVGAETEPAHSGDVTFKLTSKAPNSVNVMFFGKGHHWPGGGKHYLLNDSRQHTFHLGCQDGEQICWGASYAENDGESHWGVGYLGKQHCDDCCLTCGSNPTLSQNLTDRPERKQSGSNW